MVADIPRIVSGRISSKNATVPAAWRIFAVWHMVFGTLGYLTVVVLAFAICWQEAHKVFEVSPFSYADRTAVYLGVSCLGVLAFVQSVADLRALLRSSPGSVSFGLRFRTLNVGMPGRKLNLIRFSGYSGGAMLVVYLSGVQNASVGIVVSVLWLVCFVLDRKLARQIQQDLDIKSPL